VCRPSLASRYQAKLLLRRLSKGGEILCSESLNTLFIELEEAQGRMQGLDRTETKASVTSSTKVPDDTIHTDDLRNGEKELVTEWTSGGGIKKVTMTPTFMKEVRGHLENELHWIEQDGCSCVHRIMMIALFTARPS
jgi:hypothetical protein